MGRESSLNPLMTVVFGFLVKFYDFEENEVKVKQKAEDASVFVFMLISVSFRFRSE